jgi:hypothetical protein
MLAMRKNMPNFGWKIFVEVKDFPKMGVSL